MNFRRPLLCRPYAVPRKARASPLNRRPARRVFLPVPALLLRRRSHRVPFVALWFAAIFPGLRAAEEPPSFFATEAGLPPLRVYSPAEYGGSYQTWTMLSGPDGIVYVGDFGGVLEFDGAKWRRLAPEGLGSVRELAFLNDGRL